MERCVGGVTLPLDTEIGDLASDICNDRLDSASDDVCAVHQREHPVGVGNVACHQRSNRRPESTTWASIVLSVAAHRIAWGSAASPVQEDFIYCSASRRMRSMSSQSASARPDIRAAARSMRSGSAFTASRKQRRAVFGQTRPRTVNRSCASNPPGAMVNDVGRLLHGTDKLAVSGASVSRR